MKEVEPYFVEIQGEFVFTTEIHTICNGISIQGETSVQQTFIISGTQFLRTVNPTTYAKLDRSSTDWASWAPCSESTQHLSLHSSPFIQWEQGPIAWCGVTAYRSRVALPAHTIILVATESLCTLSTHDCLCGRRVAVIDCKSLIHCSTTGVTGSSPVYVNLFISS